MMKKQIVMPAHLMDDMEHQKKTNGGNLFNDFSSVAEATGTYTAKVCLRSDVKDLAGLHSFLEGRRLSCNALG